MKTNKHIEEKKDINQLNIGSQGAPTDLLEKSDHFCHSWGAQTGLLEKLIIFVTHGGPNCLLPEVGRKEPILYLNVDKRKHSMLNESLPKNHLLQVAICDKSYIQDKPLI